MLKKSLLLVFFAAQNSFGRSGRVDFSSRCLQFSRVVERLAEFRGRDEKADEIYISSVNSKRGFYLGWNFNWKFTINEDLESSGIFSLKRKKKKNKSLPPQLIKVRLRLKGSSVPGHLVSSSSSRTKPPASTYRCRESGTRRAVVVVARRSRDHIYGVFIFTSKPRDRTRARARER